MNDTELPPLPDDIQKLLRDTARPMPPAGFEAAVLSRLKVSLADPNFKSLPKHSVASKLGTWGVASSLASLVLGAAGGAWVGTTFLAEKPAPVVVPITLPVEAPVDAYLPKPPPPLPAAPPNPAPPPARPRVNAPPPARHPSRDQALADERALIEIARTALAKRDTAKALAALDSHLRQYPHGTLTEERESLAVQALVNASQFSEARAKAAEFRAHFPESMLLPAVDAALRSIP